jgi:hypothetical protein
LLIFLDGRLNLRHPHHSWPGVRGPRQPLVRQALVPPAGIPSGPGRIACKAPGAPAQPCHLESGALVQPFLGGLTILAGLLLWGSVADPPGRPDNADAASSTWRRTADGWEDTRSWSHPAAGYRPGLDPAVVALWQLLASLLALVAWAPGRRGTFFQDRCTDSAARRHYFRKGRASCAERRAMA